MNQQYFIPLLIAGTILFLIFLFFIISYVIIHTHRQHRNKLEKTNLIFEHQKNLLSARLDEQERAMAQISKEIHDNVAQKVDFIHMNVKAMDESRPGEDNSRFVSNSLNLLDQVTNDLRNISYSLNGDYIKQRGLGEVLEKELQYIETSKGISCVLNINGPYTSIASEQELLIYRIAQEALHNAVKYASATLIEIHLTYNTTSLTIEIKDNGVGFDMTSDKMIEGLGFRNMRQRAEILNGKLDLQSSLLNGCSVSLKIPDFNKSGAQHMTSSINALLKA